MGADGHRLTEPKVPRMSVDWRPHKATPTGHPHPSPGLLVREPALEEAQPTALGGVTG